MADRRDAREGERPDSSPSPDLKGTTTPPDHADESRVQQEGSGDPWGAPRSREWTKEDAQKGNLSGAGWGSQASGGSVIDKRPPENKPITERQTTQKDEDER